MTMYLTSGKIEWFSSPKDTPEDNQTPQDRASANRAIQEGAVEQSTSNVNSNVRIRNLGK